MNRISINGRFVVRRFGGQERYSYQIIEGLDRLANPGDFELIVPEYAEEDKLPKLKNIKIVRFGAAKGHFWEQISYYHYLKKENRIGFNPCITCPIFKPDITTLHDIGQFVNPQWYKNLYGKLSRYWHALMFKSAAVKSPLIFTISNFSKTEIVEYLKVNPDRVVVTGCGWDHFKRIDEDDGIFEKHKQLKLGEYYMSASSLTPQKNFVWIKNAAANNPNAVFAIAGERVGLTQDDGTPEPQNLYYLGFVSDGEMKALMKHCRAFIHPAKYEGFGITPMEAMSVGSPIILSNAACLPEIYGDTVRYIDPDNPNVDLDELLKQPVGDCDKILKKYTWDNMAKIVYKTLKEKIFNLDNSNG